MNRINWRFVLVSALAGAIIGLVWGWFGFVP
jgi:hypothetical protein